MWPENVGIHAIELYVPSQYVDQEELEKYDGASAGKYRIGLGQEKMAFCTDREDINSLCLTVVKKLLERYHIEPNEIGRLEVGTETILDKSKSVKTVLMQLFEPYGLTDIEGIDTTNACYGGTAAVFNAINWIESSYWNGKYALVVTADIAVYANGNARPTGGAGAIAMLIAPHAPITFDRNLRATFMRHVYDFYKPDLTSEYPIVDGKLSIQCYLNALDNCYQLYGKKYEKIVGKTMDLNQCDAFLFHTPYCKLVQKSLARLQLNDYLKRPNLYDDLTLSENVTLENSYFDRDVEKILMTSSKNLFETKTKSSLYVASQVGNMYTPSLYGGLISWLINKSPKQLAGNKICLFSYGSGLASSMFSLTVTEDVNDKKLNNLIEQLKYVEVMLRNRKALEPAKFAETLELREKVCHKAPYTPASDFSDFFPGTFYLTDIDGMHRRKYDRVPNLINGTKS